MISLLFCQEISYADDSQNIPIQFKETEVMLLFFFLLLYEFVMQGFYSFIFFLFVLIVIIIIINQRC